MEQALKISDNLQLIGLLETHSSGRTDRDLNSLQNPDKIITALQHRRDILAMLYRKKYSQQVFENCLQACEK